MSAFGSAFGEAFRSIENAIVADTSAANGNMTNQYINTNGERWINDKNVSIRYGRFDIMREARWHKVTTNYTGDVEIIGNSYLLLPTGSE